MFVVRFTRTVKKDKVYEVAKRFADWMAEGAPHGYRVYTQGFGPRDTVVYEVEFESFTEFEQAFNMTMNEPPDMGSEFLTWWAEVGVPGGTNEIWNVYASRE